MNRKKEPVVGLHLSAARDVSAKDIIVRFAFGVLISGVAGIVSTVFGTRPGGLLLAFPAILPATLTLIEQEESERKAKDEDVGAVLGAIALGPFAVIMWLFMPQNSAAAVIALAGLAWLITASALYAGLRTGAAWYKGRRR